MRAALFVLLCSCSPEAVGPVHIDSIVPGAASVGDTVDVLGSGFCHVTVVVDAGRIDANISFDAVPAGDARAADAGFDAGLVDAGVPDARPADAGVPDARPADAGRPDAGGCAAIDGFVSFGTAEGVRRVDTLAWTDARITLLVPAVAAGAVVVVVSVDGVLSNPVSFEVTTP